MCMTGMVLMLMPSIHLLKQIEMLKANDLSWENEMVINVKFFDVVAVGVSGAVLVVITSN